MATIQTVFDIVEALNREIQLQTSEADVTRALAVYNMAQRHFEAQVATRKEILGSKAGTVTTSNGGETSVYPVGLLRLDSMTYIDPGTSRPVWPPLTPLYNSQGQAEGSSISIFGSASSATGRPTAYWTDGTNIYWSPLPDAVHTVRYSGFKVATEATAAGDTFPYPSICIDAFAGFMAHVFRIGLDDPVNDSIIASAQLFGPVLDTLSKFRRESARTPTYRSTHRV